MVKSDAMDATVQVALAAGGAALISAVVTSLLAPHINWRIERKKEQLKHQRELINEWRAMASSLGNYENRRKESWTFTDWLYKDKRFYSLQPYLNEEAWKNMEINGQLVAGEVLLEEIARIEQKWKLIPSVDNSKKLRKTASRHIL